MTLYNVQTVKEFWARNILPSIILYQDRKEKGGSHSEKVTLCISCANHLHNLYPNSKLKREFNTLEKIIKDPGMKKCKAVKTFGEWIGKRDIIDIRHSNKGGFHK